MWVSEDIRTSQAESGLEPASQALISVWNRLRGGASAPLRGDLHLKQLRRLLPHLFIAERQAGTAQFTWRLAGTGLCTLLCGEVTGTSFMAGWEAFERGLMLRMLDSVTRAHHGAQLRLGFRTDRGTMVETELIALPMIARSGATHVLGGLFVMNAAEVGHHEALLPVEISAARLLSGGPTAEFAPPPQASRKFRVISGGLHDS